MSAMSEYYMAKEIEHKYIVTSDEYVRMASGSVEISQGYLNRDVERTVRVRVAGERGYLTVKGRTTGDTRDEYEYEIPVTDARAMLGMCQGRVVRKTRYYVEYGGHTWEVDRFGGDLSPLVIAEIELPESVRGYERPPFVGLEVTDDPRYYNSNL